MRSAGLIYRLFNYPYARGSAGPCPPGGVEIVSATIEGVMMADAVNEDLSGGPFHGHPPADTAGRTSSLSYVDPPEEAQMPRPGAARHITARPGRTIRVLLAESCDVIRAGMRVILNREPDITVVADVADGADLMAAAQEFQPDICMVDRDLDGADVLPLIRKLSTILPDSSSHVIITARRGADDLAAEALRLGVRGYLIKNIPPADLLDAIRATAAGHITLAPAVANQLAACWAGPPSPARTTGDGHATPPTPPTLISTVDTTMKGLDIHLTQRQREVLELVADGLSNAEIAARLFVTEATVKSHLTAVLRRLDLRDRTQLAIYAHRYRIVRSPEPA
ncbi:two component LuxR family transcriptional regulator [Candidatus Protofrankia californiensis]|uniref:Two component LuxR family transcriptional regulator n=1 Tax=Candidatus Protofrankia californiensis TaxID=1839754 RepID=A0A1C3P097_9ACTN|nr:two component LuxR family transcriptional regulator [Candidatus Protofrankia californiensis]